ncbi:MAG: LysR substrate-binding domain-containing protein, partial [Pseudomonadota bacterium]
MDLLLLRTFLAVRDGGSFSAAADAMACVQSNVTARIKKLERGLGGPVFERGKGGARPTALGLRLEGPAREILARVAQAERELRDAAGLSAALRLGSMESFAAARLPPLVAQLRAARPQAPISVRTGPTAELLQMVWDRRLDAAFVAGPVDADRFASARAASETLVRIGPPPGPGAALLAFRAGCSYRASAEAWLRSEGRSDADVMEFGTLEGILGCVVAGLGFAVAPASAVAASAHAGRAPQTPLPAPFR